MIKIIIYIALELERVVTGYIRIFDRWFQMTLNYASTYLPTPSQQLGKGAVCLLQHQSSLRKALVEKIGKKMGIERLVRAIEWPGPEWARRESIDTNNW